MRCIYLVRHGEPDTGFGPRKHLCLGQKDLPLSHEGEKQAGRLAAFFKGKELSAIYSSPLSRCMKTAETLAARSGHRSLTVQPVQDLQEVNTGIWDGMDFAEIREKYPEEYEARGKSIGRYQIPEGESFEAAGIRFSAAMEEILGHSEGDIAICAHAGVIRAFLCMLTGVDIDLLQQFPIPYASLTVLTAEENRLNDLHLSVCGWRPIESISLSEVDRIWAECGVTAEQKAHMETVADTAMNLIGYDLSLAKSDWFEKEYCLEDSVLNTRVLYFAALLHDIKRANKITHEKDGADYLSRQGYLELAEPVRMHNDPKVYQKNRPLTEAEVLYYADKIVRGDQLVTLDQRFEASRAKCRTEEVLACHQTRYEAAIGIQKKLGW